MPKPTILVTGAAGYIGSHTWLALLEAGFDVVGVDDFSNSSPEVLARLQRISGQTPRFVRADVCDPPALEAILRDHPVDGAIHFAAFKAVGESTTRPLAYYRNNLVSLMTLIAALDAHNVRSIVFSSSATVYGAPKSLPLREDAALSTTNPYGATKLMAENILRDVGSADPTWRIALLRYFNPVGAHESGHIGEDPRGMPNNLMPYITQVAVGKRSQLQVYGNDYDTSDGTGVRDYIHVQDLADGHVAALRHLLDAQKSITANLGTGQGHSVLELVRAFETASGREVPYQIVDRRPGDIAACYADASLAHRELGWQARRDLATMCADSWRWQRQNPEGYGA